MRIRITVIMVICSVMQESFIIQKQKEHLRLCRVLEQFFFFFCVICSFLYWHEERVNKVLIIHTHVQLKILLVLV